MAFYDYLFSMGLVSCPCPVEYAAWKNTSELSLIYPFDDVCCLANKATQLKMTGKQLHCDDGPAVEYADGWSVWALNGVRVPEWLVTARDTEINPRRLLEIKNAEVRREFVRKVGIDRICHTLASETLDKSGDYELLILDLQDGRKRPYLKMLNPSIGTWHVEGVDPECRTVQDALNFRNGRKDNPIVLT